MNTRHEGMTVIGGARSDFRREWRSLVVFEAAFSLVRAWLLVPASAVVLSAVMSRAGRVAVSDGDILDFLLSPLGALYAGLLAMFAAVLLLVEQAGVLALVARAAPAGPQRVRPSVRDALLSAARVTRLGAVKLGLLTAAAVPFLALLGLTYVALLARHDINYYLADRPPAFWFAAGVGGVIGLAATCVGTVLFVRWSFALPILLFERLSARDALRESRARVAGVGWRVGGTLLGWQLGALLVRTGVTRLVHLLAALLPEAAADNPAVLTLLLVAQEAILAGVSAAATLGQALLARRLYLARNEQLGLTPSASRDSPREAEDTAVPTNRRALYAAAVLLGVPVAVWVSLSQSAERRPPVRVTAHRGHSRVAPENTRSAIRAAIESGADYAEIDVQLTADGQLVLAHDRDLKRVTGDPRRIGEVALAELQTLDAGSWFGPRFAGERIPTLSEVIELSRGRIKLNVELKSSGPDRQLARETARVIGEAHFEAECVVTSFDHDALIEVRRANPNIRTGVIVAAALGDVTRLEGEVLSIQATRLTDTVLRAARRRGMEVHVWTVNDEREIFRLMAQGVDNVITDDPDRMVRARNRWADLSEAEQLALASRVHLGLE